MDTAEDYYAKDRSSWRSWLETNHDEKSAVWLVYDKGNARTMSWADIVQEALCFGWIDSRPAKISETRSKIYICRRKPNSGWSKINKAHIKELEMKGLIAPAGRAAIDLAKQNGSWDKLNNSDNLIQPPELIAAFRSNKIAKACYDSWSDSYKRQVLQWLYDAKTPETLAKRVEKVVTQAELKLKPV